MIRRALATLAFALSLAGCGSKDEGCANDRDCKGDRVCERSKCVDDDDHDARPKKSDPGSTATADTPETVAQLRIDLEAEREKSKDLLDKLQKSGDERMKLELKLKLKEAQCDEDKPTRLPKPPTTPCKCKPTDPLCDC